MDDLNLAFDLAIHTAPKDRSRAIDRYARAARLAPESDEALVLEAMRRARFSIISFERRHAVAGLIVKDLFRGVDVWLVDEGLESSLSEGAALATRLYHPEGFAMTAGVLVPLDIELIEDAIADTPQLLRNRREELIDDRRAGCSIPLIMEFAKSSGFNPLQLGLIWTFAAGGKLFAYQSGVLIVGYSYGYFEARDLVRIGAWLTVVEFVVLVLLVPFYWPLIGIH